MNAQPEFFLLILLVRLLAEYAGRRWGFMTPAQVSEKFSTEHVAEWIDDFGQWLHDYPVSETFVDELTSICARLAAQIKDTP